MAYTYQHYPLALYLRGAFMAVADKAEEDAMRAEGWADWAVDAGLSPVPEPIAPVESASDGDEHLRLLGSTLQNHLPPVEAAPQSFPALLGEGPETPLTASVGVFNKTDQAAIAQVKRKYTRKAK